MDGSWPRIFQFSPCQRFPRSPLSLSKGRPFMVRQAFKQLLRMVAWATAGRPYDRPQPSSIRLSGGGRIQSLARRWRTPSPQASPRGRGGCATFSRQGRRSGAHWGLRLDGIGPEEFSLSILRLLSRRCWACSSCPAWPVVHPPFRVAEVGGPQDDMVSDGVNQVLHARVVLVGDHETLALKVFLRGVVQALDLELRVPP